MFISFHSKNPPSEGKTPWGEVLVGFLRSQLAGSHIAEPTVSYSGLINLFFYLRTVLGIKVILLLEGDVALNIKKRHLQVNWRLVNVIVNSSECSTQVPLSKIERSPKVRILGHQVFSSQVRTVSPPSSIIFSITEQNPGNFVYSCPNTMAQYPHPRGKTCFLSRSEPWLMNWVFSLSSVKPPYHPYLSNEPPPLSSRVFLTVDSVSPYRHSSK